MIIIVIYMQVYTVILLLLRRKFTHARYILCSSAIIRCCVSHNSDQCMIGSYNIIQHAIVFNLEIRLLLSTYGRFSVDQAQDSVVSIFLFDWQ